MKKIITFIFVLALIYSQPLKADDCLNPENSYKELKKIEVFTSAAVGPAGIEPDHIKALGCLVKDKNAVEYFKKLQAKAKLPGQIYAMTALYSMDREYFDKKQKLYLKNKSIVPIQFGCMSKELKVKEMFDRIIDGTMSIKSFIN